MQPTYGEEARENPASNGFDSRCARDLASVFQLVRAEALFEMSAGVLRMDARERFNRRRARQNVTERRASLGFLAGSKEKDERQPSEQQLEQRRSFLFL